MSITVRRVLVVLFFMVAAVPALVLFLVTQPMVIPIKSSLPPADPLRLQRHVERLSIDFHPRSAEHVNNLDQAADYIVDEFRSVEPAVRVEVQPVLVGGRTYKNIIARFGPEIGPPLVIGAHYDSHGQTPGADDNASGVAGLLELARLLGSTPPAHAIELVAYTLEEPPHFGSRDMGSAWHARTLVSSGRGARLMLSLEMIGSFSDKPGSQRFPHPAMRFVYPDRGNFIAVIGRPVDALATRAVKARMAGATDLAVRSMNAPRSVVGVDFSDHRSYWDEGIPALMITDTAFFRKPEYHQAGDTHDKLDYRRMAQVVQAVHVVAQVY
jgi:Peptidase family M28